MSHKPNHFPREGAHNPVTRDAVERVAAQRPKLNTELHYTIGGPVETVVHSNTDAEREAAISTGERRLEAASQAVRRDFRDPEGDARASYLREQQALAADWRSRQRTKTPTRKPHPKRKDH